MTAQRTTITGGELIPGIQGDQFVLFTRTQVAALILLTPPPITRRPFGTPTPFDGDETFRAVQSGEAVLFSIADMAVFLAGTAPSQFVDYGKRAGPLTGSERVIGIQGDVIVAFSATEIVALLALGGIIPLGALRFSDNTPLQFSDGQYLELAA